MEELKTCHDNLKPILLKLSMEIDILKEKYTKFFNIEQIFSSEDGGKTRLNRQIFNANHTLIQKNIKNINAYLDEMLSQVKIGIKDLLHDIGEFNKIDLTNLIYDDSNFLELLSTDMDHKVISKVKKEHLLSDIEEISKVKDKIFNLDYLVRYFDTTNFDKFLNKLGIEDLVNSSFIFEIIDSYALLYEGILKFEYQIKNFDNSLEKITTFESFNSLLELHKRKVDNYEYENLRYRISVDYNIEVDLKKDIYIYRIYLENIISNFIEQSCLDLIKKELKKGKINKHIDINIFKKKSYLIINVRNNGFEIKNIDTLSTLENRFIVAAKNLAIMMDGKIEVKCIENEGMEYTLYLKI